MPRYIIRLEGSCRVTQWWRVEADDAEDALQRQTDGEGERVNEDRDVFVTDDTERNANAVYVTRTVMQPPVNWKE